MDPYKECLKKIPRDPNSPNRCNLALLNTDSYILQCKKQKNSGNDPYECQILKYLFKYKI